MGSRQIEAERGRSAAQAGASGPERTCIGCRHKFGVAELVRVSLASSGALVAGACSGRGAWLCRFSPPCFDRAVAQRAFSRALRSEVTTEAVAELRMSLWPTNEEQHSPDMGQLL